MRSSQCDSLGIQALIILSWVSCARSPLDLHQGIHQHSVEPSLAWVGGVTRYQFYVRGESSPLHCAITAPSGAPVPCEVTPWMEDLPGPSNDRLSRLTFTPSEVGWHEVLVETDADQFRTSIYSVVDREVVVAQLTRSCTWIERFPDGALLCDGVFLRPPETTEQPLDAQLSAVGGDAIWTFKDGELARRLEPLPGAVLAPPGPSLGLGEVRARRLLGTPTDVLVIHPNGVIRVELDAQGTPRVAAQLERAITSEVMLRRAGDLLLIGQPVVPWVIGSDPSSPSSPGTRVQLCAYSLGAAAIDQTGCRVYEGTLLGETDEGLLVRDAFMLRAVRASLDDGVRLRLPTTMSTGLTSTFLGLARLPWDVVPRHTGDALLLESFEGVTGASDQLVWSASAAGTRVLRR